MFIFLASCRKLPDHAKYIPKNAQLVGAIDMKQMGKKLIWNALTGSDLFREMQKELNSEESKKAMKDISNIGLKQQSSVYFYLNGKRAVEGYSCIVVGMEDQNKYEVFLKQTYPQMNPEKGEGYSSMQLEPNLFAAWNNEVAFFYPMHTSYEGDSSSVSFQLNNITNIKSSLNENFSISKENSIVSNPHFKTLQKAGHDISFWLNYEEAYLNNATASSNPFIKQDYFKEAALATGIDFEKGKAHAEMDYYMNKEMAAIYKKFQPGNINQEMVRHIPSNDIDIIGAYNLNPLMMQEYLKKFGLDGLLNLGLGMAGTTMDQIANAFKGDLIFSITDMKINTNTYKTDSFASDMAPDMKMTLAMAVKDEKELESLFKIGVKNQLLVKNGNSYTLPEMNSTASLLYTNKQLIYSSDAGMAAAYIEGKGDSKKSLPPDVWKHIASNPLVFYADLNKIMQSIPVKTDSKEDEAFINEVKKFFTYIELHGGTMKNNAVHLEGALVLSNKEENALLQFLDLGMKAKRMNDRKTPVVPSEDTLLQ